MTSAVMWRTGDIIEVPNKVYSFVLPRKLLFERITLDEDPPPCTYYEDEVFDLYHRYWPGLGMENLWLTQDEYRGLYEQEEGLA